MLAIEWQDDNNNNRDDDDDDDNNDNEDLEQQAADVMADEQSSVSEELAAISLPGHTAPAINYDGPEFPVRELQPLPCSPPPEQNAGELAAGLRRTDVLQTQVIDWWAYDVTLSILTVWRLVLFQLGK